MGLLDTNYGGLGKLAADCESRGVQIGASSVTASVGVWWQASGAAVNATNRDVTLAAQAMAARMHDTAASLEAAGRHYAETDSRSAADLRELVAEA
ncbi:hypothetical protein MHPYR_20058 [uncultured Mycobacterium sp.]|uniref:Uncharacterized protein n=1 Tax=uncultured Mycobacterium sp. TaxID=171292 RepID=A0A1Y5PAH9_9MYCO|nr:hypothetical protein MHPYR_20058 [uncultured Mycobacterium sp.]